MDLFLLCLSIALVLWGVSELVGERTLRVVAAVAAIVAGVIGFTRL